MTRWRGIVVLVAAVLAIGAGIVLVARLGETAEACTEAQEPLDGRSLQHVLPGAPEPSFDSAAPTSGPHGAAPTTEGVADRPFSRTDQVAMLERGVVLVQHRTGEPGPLRNLAGPLIVVAPNPSIDAPVVVTAWTSRLRCDELDLARIGSFITAHRGRGPGTP